MKKIITLFILFISVTSCSANVNQELKSINEDIFNGIKENNLELLKPYFFNNDNIKLCKDAFGMTDEELEKLKKGGKPQFLTYELIEKIRNEDDNGKINWKKTAFINVPKFNNTKNLKPLKTKQAEIYTTYIPFSEGEKEWQLRVMYLKTEIGFFVLQIDDEFSEYKELIISGNPDFEGNWYRPNTNPDFYISIKKSGDNYILKHSKRKEQNTGSVKDGILTFIVNDKTTDYIIDGNGNLIISTNNLITGIKHERLKE